MIHNYVRPRRLAPIELLFLTYMGIKVNRLLLQKLEDKVKFKNVADEKQARKLFFVNPLERTYQLH